VLSAKRAFDGSDDIKILDQTPLIPSFQRRRRRRRRRRTRRRKEESIKIIIQINKQGINLQ